MKSKIFTVAGLIMTAIFMMYFILAVNFTNALFPDKNSSYIALGVYVAAAALSFVIAGVLRIAEAARDGERLSRSDTFAAAGFALAAVFVPFSLRAPTVFARYSTVAVSVYGCTDGDRFRDSRDTEGIGAKALRRCIEAERLARDDSGIARRGYGDSRSHSVRYEPAGKSDRIDNFDTDH